MNIKRLAITVAMCGVAAIAAQSTKSDAQVVQSQGQQVEPMENTPVLKVQVVSRTTKAVDYRHRGGSTRVDLKGTELMPQARGEARVESRTGRLEINAKLSGMQPANKFRLEYLTYVLWALTPEGRANNLGEIILKEGTSEVRVTTDLQAFGLIVTAEPYFAVTQPSDLVVAQNIVRADTKGREEAIDVKYELLPKGLYASSVEPLRDVVYGIDSKAPLDIFQARNAVRVARAAKADQYASSTFAKAEQDLKQAEAERSKQESDVAAQKAAQERQEAEAAKAAALAQQQALEAENKQVRSQAEVAEQGRQKAEEEKAQMRARLLQQLNAILVTRDTARGLIATMPDVLFETNRFTLKPGARESMAKLAGILLAYPDLRLEVDGHTDSVGSDAYNQQLSEKRAAAVRDYLVQQGLPISSVVVR